MWLRVTEIAKWTGTKDETTIRTIDSLPPAPWSMLFASTVLPMDFTHFLNIEKGREVTIEFQQLECFTRLFEGIN